MARQLARIAVVVVGLTVAGLVVLGGGFIGLVALVVVGAVAGSLLTEYGHRKGGQHGV